MKREQHGSDGRTSLRIDVIGDHTISMQARSYAEYRVFAALTRLPAPRSVRCVRVVLRRVPSDAEPARVACAVTVVSELDSVRVRVIGQHPYAAINFAVERLQSAAAPSPAFHCEPTLSD